MGKPYLQPLLFWAEEASVARGEAAAAERGGSGRAWPPYPAPHPGPGLTMTIRKVLSLHEIRFQHLKAHEHLGEQHHQVDLEAEGRVSHWDPRPRTPASAHEASRRPYLEGRWDVQQVLEGQWAATRKAGGTEILHQLEVVEAVRHRHGVLEAHLCGDRIPGSPALCGGRGPGEARAQQATRTEALLRAGPQARCPLQSGYYNGLFLRPLQLFPAAGRTRPPGTQVRKLLLTTSPSRGAPNVQNVFLDEVIVFLSQPGCELPEVRSMSVLCTLGLRHLKQDLAHSSHSINICCRREFYEAQRSLDTCARSHS